MLKSGTKVALNPVSVFILICGNSVNLPPLSTDTDLIFPKGSQLYERTVPLLGITSMVSTPQLWLNPGFVIVTPVSSIIAGYCGTVCGGGRYP